MSVSVWHRSQVSRLHLLVKGVMLLVHDFLCRSSRMLMWSAGLPGPETVPPRYLRLVRGLKLYWQQAKHILAE